jgi:hypothetical protein
MLNLFAYFLFLFRFKYLTIDNSKNQMLEKNVILANRKILMYKFGLHGMYHHVCMYVYVFFFSF